MTLVLLTEGAKGKVCLIQKNLEKVLVVFKNQIWGVIKRKAQIVMNSSNLSIRLNNAL